MIPRDDVLAMAVEAELQAEQWSPRFVHRLECFANKAAAYDNVTLSALADKVVISNATGNESLFLASIQELIGAIRARNTHDATDTPSVPVLRPR